MPLRGWGFGVVFLPSRRLLFACLRRWVFLDLGSLGVGFFLSGCLRRWVLLDLDFLVFGLSLFSYWFISVAPVRGRHLLFFACCKEK
jgi:apolipoprotein N-acyltransferase